MTTLHFTGESYFAPGYEFTGPGDYSIKDDAKAAQLLADFPQLFSKASEPEKQPKEAAKEPTQEQDKKGTK
jgi:hypothetical protein